MYVASDKVLISDYISKFQHIFPIKHCSDKQQTTRKTGNEQHKRMSARNNLPVNDNIQLPPRSKLVYCYRCINVSFINLSKSAAPWIVCKDSFLQDPLHSKPQAAFMLDAVLGEHCLPEFIIKHHSEKIPRIWDAILYHVRS